MKYKKIAGIEQYVEYCNLHEELGLENEAKHRDDLDLLEILIDEYDRRKQTYNGKMNPVQVLNSILEEENISKAELGRELGVSRQLISDILRFRRNISKEMVTKLSEYFKMRPEAFSRPYKLNLQIRGKISETA